MVQAFQDVLAIEGNVDRGKEVFERAFSKCHLAQAERGRIDPDLSGVNNRNMDTLLNDILNPSAAIQRRYTNYIVETKDGRIYDGLIVSESLAVVVIRGEYEDMTVVRDSIQPLRASRVSLMPEGLEETLSRQDLTYVILYLRSGI